MGMHSLLTGYAPVCCAAAGAQVHGAAVAGDAQIGRGPCGEAKGGGGSPRALEADHFRRQAAAGASHPATQTHPDPSRVSASHANVVCGWWAQVAYDDVFSLAPLTLLELSHVGRGNFFETEARGSQTNDDSCTVELQTEHVRGSHPAHAHICRLRCHSPRAVAQVETRTVKAQCPEDMGVSREAVERASDASKRKTRALPGWSATGGTDQPLHGDGSSARRLNKFVTHVGPIVEALLHERVKKEVRSRSVRGHLRGCGLRCHYESISPATSAN